MKEWRIQFPIKVMCRVLNVSRSGFYTWLRRKPSRRAQEDERLKVAIKAAHKRTRESYSARRLQPELAADGKIRHPEDCESETCAPRNHLESVETS